MALVLLFPGREDTGQTKVDLILEGALVMGGSLRLLSHGRKKLSGDISAFRSKFASGSIAALGESPSLQK
jgi:hypothetical protein